MSKDSQECVLFFLFSFRSVRAVVQWHRGPASCQTAPCPTFFYLPSLSTARNALRVSLALKAAACRDCPQNSIPLGRVRKRHPRMFYLCFTHWAPIRKEDRIPFEWCFRTQPRQANPSCSSSPTFSARRLSRASPQRWSPWLGISTVRTSLIQIIDYR